MTAPFKNMDRAAARPTRSGQRPHHDGRRRNRDAGWPLSTPDDNCDGSAIIYSAIALNEAEMARLEAFGQPRFLVVPSERYRLDAGIFQETAPHRFRTPRRSAPGTRLPVQL